MPPPMNMVMVRKMVNAFLNTKSLMARGYAAKEVNSSVNIVLRAA